VDERFYHNSREDLVMNIQTIAKQFVDMCNQGKNFDVMRAMYDPNIVSVESDGKQTAGQQPVIQKSERWAQANEIHGEKVRGPYINGDRFAVHFTFDITPRATGKRLSQEEVGVYTVKGDKIVREEFFNSGAW
jgi:ketosteroid isomerase-like protein